MKFMPKLVFALAAVGSCVAVSAQSDSDMDRRARNREEAVSNWQRTHDGDSAMERDDMRPHKSLRERTHEGAQKTRSVTHRQLDKVRDFGERQQRRYQKPTAATHESDKSSTAVGR